MDGYFFLVAAAFASEACFFFSSALLVLDCFWFDFFWLDFGDLSPINVLIGCELTHLRHDSFSEGRSNMVAGAVIVNDGGKIIWRERQPQPLRLLPIVVAIPPEPVRVGLSVR